MSKKTRQAHEEGMSLKIDFTGFSISLFDELDWSVFDLAKELLGELNSNRHLDLNLAWSRTLRTDSDGIELKLKQWHLDYRNLCRSNSSRDADWIWMNRMRSILEAVCYYNLCRHTPSSRAAGWWQRRELRMIGGDEQFLDYWVSTSLCFECSLLCF